MTLSLARSKRIPKLFLVHSNGLRLTLQKKHYLGRGRKATSLSCNAFSIGYTPQELYENFLVSLESFNVTAETCNRGGFESFCLLIRLLIVQGCRSGFVTIENQSTATRFVVNCSPLSIIIVFEVLYWTSPRSSATVATSHAATFVTKTALACLLNRSVTDLAKLFLSVISVETEKGWSK